MNEPRPAVISARPSETASSVANRSKTRTGSSELSTVTEVPSWIRRVRPAIAASSTSGALIEKSGRWCSPTPKKSRPTAVGQHGLLDHLAQRHGVVDRLSVRPRLPVAEGVQPERRRLRGAQPGVVHHAAEPRTGAPCHARPRHGTLLRHDNDDPSPAAPTSSVTST